MRNPTWIGDEPSRSFTFSGSPAWFSKDCGVCPQYWTMACSLFEMPSYKKKRKKMPLRADGWWGHPPRLVAEPPESFSGSNGSDVALPRIFHREGGEGEREDTLCRHIIMNSALFHAARPGDIRSGGLRGGSRPGMREAAALAKQMGFDQDFGPQVGVIPKMWSHGEGCFGPHEAARKDYWYTLNYRNATAIRQLFK